MQDDGDESVKSGKVLLTGEISFEFTELEDNEGKTSEGLAVSVNEARIEFFLKVGEVLWSNVLDKIRISVLQFEHVVQFEKSFVGFWRFHSSGVKVPEDDLIGESVKWNIVYWLTGNV